MTQKIVLTSTSNMTRVFHIVGKKDRPCPERKDGSIISRDKKDIGHVVRFKSPSGGNTFKGTLEGYWVISDEELAELKK